MLGLVIAVSTNKGGVGKTTTTITLAHALGNLNKKVLVIDHDPQGNTSKCIRPIDENALNMADLYYADNPNPEDYVYRTEYKNVDVIQTTTAMALMEPDLIARPGFSYSLMQEILGDYVRENYDYIIIDTPPNIGVFTLQAMVMADSIIIPVAAGSRFGLDGLATTVSSIKAIRDEHCTLGCRIHILITLAQMRTNVSKTIVGIAKDSFPDLLFDTIISRNTSIEQAESEYKTVIRLAPRAYGSISYKSLAKELVKIYEG